MRIAFLAGPANAPEIYRQWSTGERQAYFGTDYLKQFLQLAEDIDAEALVFTWHGERAVHRLGRFAFDNRPLTKQSGALYYAGQLWWHLKLIPALLRFKPDVLILTGNQGFWWTLAPVRAKLLPSFHSVLWPKYGRTKLPVRFLLSLEKWLILKRCKVVVATAHDIGRQVRRMTDAEILYHLPTYSPEQFEGVEPPIWSKPFRVIFCARIEANKGVFDVLEMARRLPDVLFGICGSGSALEDAKAQAPANVTFHGLCDQEKLRAIMGAAHVSIVPTRSDFEAGFEMTCAEAVLSGRPLITSGVCPAREYLVPALLEVEPDNVDQYVEAIERLRDDGALYEQLCDACPYLKGQFFDPKNSWLTAMKKALSRLGF